MNPMSLQEAVNAWKRQHPKVVELQAEIDRLTELLREEKKNMNIEIRRIREGS